MSNTNPQVKSLQQPCAASDLQPPKSQNEKSNVLYLNGKNSVAATVCNTPNVDTDDDMHTVHAEVGLTTPDIHQHIKDIDNMTEAALKKAYPKEHNSWRSRRSTAKKESLPWSPKFDGFSGFLRIVGPKPKPDYQLDKRIKEYGYVPDNVRWVSPTQNSLNRDATRFLTHNGETHSVSTWARKTNTSKSTLFGRLRMGWSPSEAITGCHATPSPSYNLPESQLKISNAEQRAWAYTPWPNQYRIQWECLYQEHGWRVEARLEFYVRYSALMASLYSNSVSENYPPDDECYSITKEQEDEKMRLIERCKNWLDFNKDAARKYNERSQGSRHLYKQRYVPESVENLLCDLAAKHEKI